VAIIKFTVIANYNAINQSPESIEIETALTTGNAIVWLSECLPVCSEAFPSEEHQNQPNETQPNQTKPHSTIAELYDIYKFITRL